MGGEHAFWTGPPHICLFHHVGVLSKVFITPDYLLIHFLKNPRLRFWFLFFISSVSSERIPVLFIWYGLHLKYFLLQRFMHKSIYNFSTMVFYSLPSRAFFAVEQSYSRFRIKRNVEQPLCYQPDGTLAWGDYACDLSNSDSTCCGGSMICLNNQMCWSESEGAYYRGSCTDKTWKSSNCPQFCTGQWRNGFYFCSFCPSSILSFVLSLRFPSFSLFLTPCTPVLRLSTSYQVLINFLMFASNQAIHGVAMSSCPAAEPGKTVSDFVVTTPSTAARRE